MDSYKKAKSLITVLLSTAIVSGSFISAFADNIATVNDSEAAIVSAPSLEAPAVSTLDVGQSLNVLGSDGDYYKVAFEGLQNAFVLNDFVTVVEADGIVVGDNVIVRAASSEDAETVGSLSYGDEVVVTGINGNFYRIKFDDKECFVHSDFVIGDMIYSVQKIDSAENGGRVKGKFGTIISDGGAKLRRTPDTEGDVYAVIDRNSVLTVVAEGEEWTTVVFEDTELFISSPLIVTQTGVKPETEPVVLSHHTDVAAKADAIIAYGKKFIGTPYSWGGTNLSRGVDCSGFTQAVMKANGVSISRTSRSQANDGYRVSKSELQKGDLVFFSTGGSGISHVGIYIGDGNFIHSSSGNKWGVTIDSLSSAYYTRNYVTASRVLN